MDPVKITVQREIYFFQRKEKKTETANLARIFPLDAIGWLLPGHELVESVFETLFSIHFVACVADVI